MALTCSFSRFGRKEKKEGVVQRAVSSWRPLSPCQQGGCLRLGEGIGPPAEEGRPRGCEDGCGGVTEQGHSGCVSVREARKVGKGIPAERK